MRSRIDYPLDTGRPLVMILGDDRDEEDHNVLFPALRSRGADVIRVHPLDLVTHLSQKGICFSVHGQTIAPDVVVGWVLDDLLIPGMVELDVLFNAGIPVINDALTLFRAEHKLLDGAQRAAAGTLTRPAISGYDRSALLRGIDRLGFPFVVKPPHGYGGIGIERIESSTELRAMTSGGNVVEEPYYAMPWIDNPGRDIRVYTINHHAVFAMYRYAPDGAWITNVKAGGTIAMCPLSTELAALASRASRTAGTLLGGIDIGEDCTTGEYVVYEVNSCPTCEPPVLEMMADFLAEAAFHPDTALETWAPTKVYSEPDSSPDLFHSSKRHLLRPA